MTGNAERKRRHQKFVTGESRLAFLFPVERLLLVAGVCKLQPKRTFTNGVGKAIDKIFFSLR